MSYDDTQETQETQGFRRSSGGKAERHRNALIRLGKRKRKRQEVQRSLRLKKSSDPLSAAFGRRG